MTQISHLLENIFNNYFVNVGSNINKSIPIIRKSPTDYLKNRNADSMLLSTVTEQKIKFIIQSLNSQKAIGPCSIPVFLMKTKHIAKPLSVIVNLSFQAGVFPGNLKVAKVSPLHKKDSCDNP